MRRPPITALLVSLTLCWTVSAQENKTAPKPAAPTEQAAHDRQPAADQPSPAASASVDGRSQLPPIQPKELSDNVKKGLDWLARSQHENGGWSEGEESQHMQSSGQGHRGTPNVADTCAATLALMRAGSTPSSGVHARHIQKALEYISGQIENSEPAGLYVTDVRGTRVQSKLGPYIDTFLAALVLAEVKDRMPDEASRKRVVAALDKVMDKIEKNQRSDGTFADEGWAPVLSQSMAAKAVNRAAQSGVPVSEAVLGKIEKQARGEFDDKGGKFGGRGSAGVELYSVAGNLGAMQDSANTNAQRRRELEEKAKSAPTPEERKDAEDTLRRYDEAGRELAQAQKAVADRLDDQRFIAGFGSNGGEEFLSYMNIGESLASKGGEEWARWDKSMTENLNRIQNPDGSWTGHHCITGRTFCTSTALLVLTVDRAPVPVAGKFRRQ